MTPRTIAARDGAGVVQVDAEVLGNVEVGDYRHLTLVTPGLAELARPGQFVALSVGDGTSSMLLRRSFSIHRVSPQGTYGGTTEIVVAPHGPGTRQLTALEPGASVGVVGPLGRGFPLPSQPVPCILVGGGYGGASAAKALSLLGADVTVYEQASAIREVGAGGNFLLEDDTLDRYDTEFYLSDLFSCENYERWEGRGRPDVLDKAAKMVEKRLEEYKAPEYTPEQMAILDEVLKF